jgi:hypothetical protein
MWIKDYTGLYKCKQHNEQNMLFSMLKGDKPTFLCAACLENYIVKHAEKFEFARIMMIDAEAD